MRRNKHGEMKQAENDWTEMEQAGNNWNGIYKAKSVPDEPR